MNAFLLNISEKRDIINGNIIPKMKVGVKTPIIPENVCGLNELLKVPFFMVT